MDFDGAAAGRVCDVMLVYVKVEQRNPRLLNFFHSFFSKRARFAFLNKNRDLMMIRGENRHRKEGVPMQSLSTSFRDGWSCLVSLSFGDSPVEVLVRALILVKGFVVRVGKEMRRSISGLWGWLSGYNHRLRGIADRGTALG